ncbi:hypothetical protein P3T76_006028 [Phytophthora citrophthora]|uniref:Uncharacterized protein n=1 Tax=Phytophthora citrophthora TaxID=4793 RepID=A0AAD9GQ45_9STRA|nr:hypothetical protein P3T76_006028 [Phytophthora citrophthora]
MKILQALALLALAIQCTLATSERKLLRSGYDSPVNFSDLPSLTDANAEKDISKKGGILPNTDSLTTNGLGKDILPTDLTTVAGGRSGLQSLTDGSGLESITNGVAKGGKLPSLPTGSARGVPQGLSGITDNVSGLSNGLALSSSATNGGKQMLKSSVKDNRSLESPKKGLRSPQPKKSSVKKANKKRGSAKNSHKPNVKPTPKPDPEKSPF